MIRAEYFPGLAGGMTVLGLRGALPVATKVQNVQAIPTYSRVGMIAEGRKLIVDPTQKIYAPGKDGILTPKPFHRFRVGDRVSMVISGMPCVGRVSALLEETGEATMIRVRTASRNIVVEGFLCRA